MSLLDRYIFKSVFFTCAAAVGLFTFIVIVPNVARELLPYVLGGQLPGATFTKLVLLLLPYAITYALPMGMLTGVLLTLGRLSADSEITAMRTAGISMMRITRPVLVLASLGAIVALYFNFESMPATRVEYYRAFAAAVRSNPLSIIVPKTFIRDFPGYVVYVGEKKGGELRDFWLYELDQDRRVARVVRAQSGTFDYEEATNSLVLTLSQAQIETRQEKNPEKFTESPIVGSFERSEPIKLPLDILRSFRRRANEAGVAHVCAVAGGALHARRSINPVGRRGRGKTRIGPDEARVDLQRQVQHRAGRSFARADWSASRHQSLAARNLGQLRGRRCPDPHLLRADPGRTGPGSAARTKTRSAALAPECHSSHAGNLAPDPHRQTLMIGEALGSAPGQELCWCF